MSILVLLKNQKNKVGFIQMKFRQGGWGRAQGQQESAPFVFSSSAFAWLAKLCWYNNLLK